MRAYRDDLEVMQEYVESLEQELAEARARNEDLEARDAELVARLGSFTTA